MKKVSALIQYSINHGEVKEETVEVDWVMSDGVYQFTSLVDEADSHLSLKLGWGAADMTYFSVKLLRDQLLHLVPDTNVLPVQQVQLASKVSWAPLVKWWESGAKDWEELRGIVSAMISQLSPHAPTELDLKPHLAKIQELRNSKHLSMDGQSVMIDILSCLKKEARPQLLTVMNNKE